MKLISAKEIKNSLLSSAGFEVVSKPDDKPSTRTDVADKLAAIIYIRPKGALFLLILNWILPFTQGLLLPLRVRRTLASEDI